MRLRLYQVDAFTDLPFAGNPAAVAVVRSALPEPFMRAVADEMNLSETAFIVPADEGSFRLRWFTPVAEVDLCGHATLAGAHVLWEQAIVDLQHRIRFDTLSGRLEVWREEALIWMDFPSERAARVDPPEILKDAVPAEIVDVGRNRLDYLVVLSSEEELRSLQPDLGAVENLGSRGMIVTAPSSMPEYDFVSRYFAPQFGIPEDPVTGSAHCCLGPYWAERIGRTELTGFQASARGGHVHVAVRGDRVSIGGRAVSTATIDLLVEVGCPTRFTSPG